MNSIFRAPLTPDQKAIWRAEIVAPSARYLADLKAAPNPTVKKLRKVGFKAELADIRARVLALTPEGNNTPIGDLPSPQINTAIAAGRTHQGLEEPDENCGLCHWWGWPNGEPCCCESAKPPK
ncbi:hypothetical protein [Phenylobacterium sp.]|uniref:hypothetical protein n=1 Tax=Phenylobacterium sp. TaxID=1871053 RepID=UPI0035ADC9EA